MYNKLYNPGMQYRDSEQNDYLTQLLVVEVHRGWWRFDWSKTNFHCSNADGWTQGTLFYPINFLFLDPPNY